MTSGVALCNNTATFTSTPGVRTIAIASDIATASATGYVTAATTTAVGVIELRGVGVLMAVDIGW